MNKFDHLKQEDIVLSYQNFVISLPFILRNIMAKIRNNLTMSPQFN